MDTGIPIPKTAENKVRETLHFIEILGERTQVIWLQLKNPSI